MAGKANLSYYEKMEAKRKLKEQKLSRKIYENFGVDFEVDDDDDQVRNDLLKNLDCGGASRIGTREGEEVPTNTV